MNTKKYTYTIAVMALLIVLLGATPAFAAENDSAKNGSRPGFNKQNSDWAINKGRPMMGGQGIFGIVKGVNGNTITVDSAKRIAASTTVATTTYTVDVTNAKIVKNNATSTVSAILVGDNVSVRGTINGTSVVATSVFDGVGPRGMGNMRMNDGKMPMFDKNIDQNDVAGNIQKAKSGLFGRMGSFFARIFGL